MKPGGTIKGGRDAACMDWGNVDMERRLIRYTPRKTARKKPDPLLIPIHPELYAVLSETPPAKRRGQLRRIWRNDTRDTKALCLT